MIKKKRNKIVESFVALNKIDQLIMFAVEFLYLSNKAIKSQYFPKMSSF